MNEARLNQRNFIHSFRVNNLFIILDTEIRLETFDIILSILEHI